MVGPDEKLNLVLVKISGYFYKEFCKAPLELKEELD